MGRLAGTSGRNLDEVRRSKRAVLRFGTCIHTVRDVHVSERAVVKVLDVRFNESIKRIGSTICVEKCDVQSRGGFMVE